MFFAFLMASTLLKQPCAKSFFYFPGMRTTANVGLLGSPFYNTQKRFYQAFETLECETFNPQNDSDSEAFLRIGLTEKVKRSYGGNTHLGQLNVMVGLLNEFQYMVNIGSGQGPYVFRNKQGVVVGFFWMNAPHTGAPNTQNAILFVSDEFQSQGYGLKIASTVIGDILPEIRRIGELSAQQRLGPIFHDCPGKTILRRVVATTDPENAPMLRILDQLDFQPDFTPSSDGAQPAEIDGAGKLRALLRAKDSGKGGERFCFIKEIPAAEPEGKYKKIK
ncbi:MAG: GNAT family N-acetyltransferase [Alphaproteobacteria bacterium]|nr:MAG: GNAT family N-acetyltransferase [Alphaproteobacteria bacterium]